MGETITARGTVAKLQKRSLDMSAFEELYTAFLPKVYNYVSFRVGDAGTAEDVTADVFERALTRLHTYRSDRGAFSTWLFSIAHNSVANHLRDRGRRPESFSLDSLPPVAATGHSVEQRVIAGDQLRWVREHMQYLPEKQREVVALKFGGGLSNREIARAMRLKPNHVGVLLHRAVRSLRLAMEKEDVE
jgi:RNA polymerase sigma-70 factor (ECF subfamily)